MSKKKVDEQRAGRARKAAAKSVLTGKVTGKSVAGRSGSAGIKGYAGAKSKAVPPAPAARPRVPKVLKGIDVVKSASTRRPGLGTVGREKSQIDVAVARFRELLEQAADPQREKLVEALEPGPDAGVPLDDSFFGPPPTPVDAAASEIAQLRLRFERRRQVTNTSITREQAAELLDVSPQAVLNHINAGDLVAMKQGKRWVLPGWQFDPEAERGFAPGIKQVSDAFPGGPVALSRWIVKANPQLGSRAPRDVLIDGDIERVVTLARDLTSAGW